MKIKSISKAVLLLALLTSTSFALMNPLMIFIKIIKLR